MDGVIHFLNTGHSDCIIIESCGRFAMVDAAEDSEYPENKPDLNLPGYEDEVCRYLAENCADESGIVTLDFILGTHSHSDHIGGFDTVINHPKIRVKKAYLKPYHEEDINDFERREWDNAEVYNQMRQALEDNNVPITEAFDGEIMALGNLKITFFNGTYKKPDFPAGENVNSVVTLVEGGTGRVLLAGDMNCECGGEQEIAPKIGKIDLLKIGHHCYEGSSSTFWLETLSPDYAVITNGSKYIDKTVLQRIVDCINPEIYPTGDLNGIKAYFTQSSITIETNIM